MILILQMGILPILTLQFLLLTVEFLFKAADSKIIMEALMELFIFKIIQSFKYMIAILEIIQGEILQHFVDLIVICMFMILYSKITV